MDQVWPEHVALTAKNKSVQDNVLFRRGKRLAFAHGSKVRFVAPEHDPDSRSESLAAFPFHVPSPDLEALLFISSSTAEVRDDTSHSKMVMFAPKQWTIGILLLSFLSIDLLIGKPVSSPFPTLS